MKRIILTTALLVASAPVAAQSRPAIEDFRVAGIHVIHKPIAANDVIAVTLYLTGGSAALTPKMAGVEEMIVSTVTLGTEKYTKDQFTALSTATIRRFCCEPCASTGTRRGISSRKRWRIRPSRRLKWSSRARSR